MLPITEPIPTRKAAYAYNIMVISKQLNKNSIYSRIHYGDKAKIPIYTLVFKKW
jgi:hypothetical protein